MSPPVHNAGFDAADVNAVYLPMPIPPEYEHFKATVSSWLAMPGLDFGGASVTIPHKENLLAVREGIRGRDRAVGRAYRGGEYVKCARGRGSLYACNTDYAGGVGRGVRRAFDRA